MTQIESYPKVYTLGHKAVMDILDGPVLVQEKVDGSQISFGVLEGELVIRSRGQHLVIDAPEKMFLDAVKVIKNIEHELTPGYIYRGEYLKTPKHNTLAYDRIPTNHIILFDVQTGPGKFLDKWDFTWEASRLVFESVPVFFEGYVKSLAELQQYLDRESVLGGQKVEGVVIKNYSKFTPDGKLMTAKLVSEKFKEVHGGEWRKNNPTSQDITDRLIVKYRTPSRWEKAIQHLAEAGKLEGTPRDIGKLMVEVPNDILEEEEEAIKDALFAYFWPKIRRGVVAGLPEWYKNRLAEQVFQQDDSTFSWVD